MGCRVFFCSAGLAAEQMSDHLTVFLSQPRIHRVAGFHWFVGARSCCECHSPDEGQLARAASAAVSNRDATPGSASTPRESTATT